MDNDSHMTMMMLASSAAVEEAASSCVTSDSTVTTSSSSITTASVDEQNDLHHQLPHHRHHHHHQQQQQQNSVNDVTDDISQITSSIESDDQFAEANTNHSSTRQSPTDSAAMSTAQLPAGNFRITNVKI